MQDFLLAPTRAAINAIAAKVPLVTAPDSEHYILASDVNALVLAIKEYDDQFNAQVLEALPASLVTDSELTVILAGYSTDDELSDAIGALGTAAERNVGTATGNVVEVQSNGKILDTLISSLFISEVFPVASQAEMLALTAQRGDVALRSDIQQSFILATDDPTNLVNWKPYLSPADGVISFNGRPGIVTLTSQDVTDALTFVPFANPMTSPGDLIVGGVAGAPARLPKGTALQVVRVNAGATALEYATLSALANWEENGTDLRPKTDLYNFGDATHRIGDLFARTAKLAVGSEAAPSHSFADAPGDGMWSYFLNYLGFSAGSLMTVVMQPEIFTTIAAGGYDVRITNHSLFTYENTQRLSLYGGRDAAGGYLQLNVSSPSVSISAPSAAPADGDLLLGHFSFFRDEASNSLKVKVKYADGVTIKTGTVSALT